MGHEERTHALLSASGAHRWIACPPSARLEAQFPDTPSPAAEEGTTAHELAEMKLRNYFFKQDLGKRKLTEGIKTLKKRDVWDDEMLEHTDTYLEYIKAAALRFPVAPAVCIEKQVRFDAYVPEGFGTADCVLIGGGTIHVIDLKYGKSPNGRVGAEGNPQMILYALGVYLSYRMLYRIERIRMSIVQPRLPEGISEWEIPLEELLERGEYIKARAALAFAGEGGYAPDEKTCRYCRARGRCTARAEKNIQLAFSEDMGKLPPLIDNARLGDLLRKGADVAKWLSDLQDCALSECLKGNEVPGWKAVEGRSVREWTDMDAAFSAMQGSGVEEAMLWEKKPVTLAQAEKLLGKKEFAAVAGSFVVKKPGKPALVPETDKRAAVTNVVTAAEAFGLKKEGEDQT